MAAVMVADYLVLPLFGVKHNYNYNDISYENLPLIKWPSVLAWGCGVAVAIFSPGIQAINDAGIFSIGIGDAEILSAADMNLKSTDFLTLELINNIV